MNKNTLIGTILISILIMWYVSNSAKTAEKQAEKKVETVQKAEKITEEKSKVETLKQQLIQVIDKDSTALNEAELEAKKEFGSFYKSIVGTEQITTLENNLLKIEISNKGAQIQKVTLKNFTTWDKKPLILINNSQTLNLSLASKETNKNIETKDLFFNIEKLSDNKISLKLKANDQSYIEQIYALNDDSYFLDFDINFVNLDQIVANGNNNIKADWFYTVLKQEKGLDFEKQKSTIYWKQTDSEVMNLSPGTSKEESIVASEWIAFKDQFFNTTLLTDNNIAKGNIKSTFIKEDSLNVAQYNAQFDFTQKEDNTLKLAFFFGPNDYKMLKSYNKGQEEIVELSTNFFLFKWVKYVTKWVVIPIFRFLDGFNLNYGIIIILLTFIIRTALMPLTWSSYVSTAKTKLLKPELDSLREKYKDDQQKFAAEQMKLYQKTGVSMFGGCLPMLLQMPFFLAMFYFFPSSIELRQQSFLWATDLSTYDVLFNLPFNIPIYGAHVSGFTLLMTISSLVAAKFNPQMQNNNLQPGMEVMKYMPYIFPFFLMILFNSWSGALTFYYFVSNLITLGQQVFINKFMIDENKLKLQIEENRKKPQKQGGFRSKMEELYKQQQELENNKKTSKKK